MTKIVVIGAGVGGLTAAAALAMCALSVRALPAFSSSTRGSTRTSIGRSLRYEGRIAAIRGLEWIINGGSLLKHAPLMPPHLRRSYPYASIPPRRRRGSTPVTFMCRSGSGRTQDSGGPGGPMRRLIVCNSV